MLKTIFFDINGTLCVSKEFDKVQSERAKVLLAERKGISLDEAKRMFKEKKEELKTKRDFVAKTHVLAECGISRNEWQEFLLVSPLWTSN